MGHISLCTLAARNVRVTHKAHVYQTGITTMVLCEPGSISGQPLFSSVPKSHLRLYDSPHESLQAS